MAEVALLNISKSFDETTVLRDLSLHIPDGEFCVILGPSGCGKSTLLRLIAGLESPNSGSIHIGGQDVTGTEARDRGVGMVFQNYALYPHMTVAENIGFPLKLRKAEPAKIATRSKEVASMLGLGDLLERRPRQLSGGQRQRVALGRAIVQEPKVYLLDEPLSNVDALLRVKMRNEIARLWKTLGTTVVYVTHDQSEALALGTKICVLHEGRVQQTGTAREIYDMPRNRFVSEFVGTPPINMASGRLRMDRNIFFDPWQMPLPLDMSANLRSWQGRDIQLAIRPEAITATDDPGSKFAMKGEIEQVEYLGAVTWLSCRVAGELIVARTDGTASDQVGRTCHLIPDREKLHWFHPETGERL